MTNWLWPWLVGAALIGVAALATVALATFGDPTRQRPRWLVASLLLVVFGLAAWRTWVAIEAPVFYRQQVPAQTGSLAAQFAYVAPRDTHILGLAWTADGEGLLVYMQVGALDLWRVIVTFWPEVALLVLALVAVVSRSVGDDPR